MNKTKSVISFIAVILVIAFLGALAYTGFYLPGGMTMPFLTQTTATDTATTDTTTTGTDTTATGTDTKAAEGEGQTGEATQTPTNAPAAAEQAAPAENTAEGENAADTATEAPTTAADGAKTADTADTADTTGTDTAEAGTGTATAAAEPRAIIPSVLDHKNGIRLGLDLVGGSRIVYEAMLPEGYDMTKLADDMQTAQQMIRTRLTYQGFTEATVTLTGDRRLTVEIPQITNPEEAVQTLGSTAQLSFMDIDGKTWLAGGDIKKATAMFGRPTGTELTNIDYVQLEFTTEGTTKFSEATAAISARTDGTNLMLIVMDDQVISYPQVTQQLTQNTCVISPMESRERAQELANLINVGQMPFSLSQVELRSVGPQLGADAMRTSLVAGLIGLALVCLFMIFIYRLPGFVAVLALAFYVILEALLFGIFRVNLSLPGIAGIILSIGMAVDANVIIFERIREELRAGKTVKTAVDAGFKRAFTSILDSNLTTLIAAGVLLWQGTGTIVGFATTLAIGVIVSMFTALTVTHFFLNRMVDFNLRNPGLYGAKQQNGASVKQPFSVLSRAKIFGGISVLLCATGLVALILLPFGKNLFNLSIDFAGGTELEFNVNQPVTQQLQTDIAALVKEQAGVSATVTSSGDNGTQALIRTTSINSEARDKVIRAMQDKYKLTDKDLYGNQDVSASVGQDLKNAAVICAVLAILLMLIYISFRFELTSGLAAICCLVHDLLIMLSVYVIFQIPLDSGFIAAALTILGYSINASIIVFDRVRENLRLARRESFAEVADKSIWQTMGRTINTTLTTLFTVGAIFILGVPSLKQFTLPLIVGILAGAWSSIFLSSAFWAGFRKLIRKKS